MTGWSYSSINIFNLDHIGAVVGENLGAVRCLLFPTTQSRPHESFRGDENIQQALSINLESSHHKAVPWNRWMNCLHCSYLSCVVDIGIM